MKILHIIESTATGTLTMLRLLTKGQVENSHEVKIIYSRRSETPLDLKRGFLDEVEFINIQMHSLTEQISAIKRIRRIVKASNADVVFLHSSFAGFIGRICLIGIVGPNIFYIPHCISFQRRDVGVIKKYCFIALEWIGSLRSSTYVACSKSEYQAITKYIPFSRCLTIENAVSNDLVESSHSQKPTKPSIICVGQIRRQKDPRLFSCIAASIRKDYPDVDVIWVGDGDEELRSDLENSGVSVTGWVKQDVVSNYLSNATIYLSTSLWEGMPVSLIEAQLSRLAVIARNCPGNADVIQDGVSGMLFETVDEAISLVTSLLDDSVSAVQLGIRSYEVAKLRFSESRYAYEMNKMIVGAEN